MSWTLDAPELAATWLQLLWPLALEAAIVGLLLWLLVRCGRRMPSPVRHGLLLLALVKFLVPAPAAPWTLSLPVPPMPVELLHASSSGKADAAAPRERTLQQLASAAGSESGSASAPVAAAVPERWHVREPDGGQQRLRPTNLSSTHRSPPAVAPVGPLNPVTTLVLLHLCGAVILLARRAAQVRSLRRQTRRCCVIEDPAI